MISSEILFSVAEWRHSGRCLGSRLFFQHPAPSSVPCGSGSVADNFGGIASWNAKFTDNIVRVGLNYKFGN